MKLEQYRAELDALRFSDEQKLRMIDRLMAAQEAASARRPRRLHRVPLLAVLLAALLLTAGGFAVKLVSDWFAPRYGAADHGLINEVGAIVGASDTHEGVTITVDAIMGDRHTMQIAFTVSRDDGTPMTRDTFEDEFGRVYPDWKSWFTGGGSDVTHFADVDEHDNRFEMYHTIHRDRLWMAKMVTIKVTNQHAPTELRPEEEHVWTISFWADYPDCTVELDCDQTIPTKMGEATIDQLEVSPLGIYLKGHYEESITKQMILESMRTLDPDSVDLQQGWTDSAYYIPEDFTVGLKDGTMQSIVEKGGGSTFGDGVLRRFYRRVDFSGLIDTDDIASISINGVTVELP